MFFIFFHQGKHSWRICHGCFQPHKQHKMPHAIVGSTTYMYMYTLGIDILSLKNSQKKTPRAKEHTDTSSLTSWKPALRCYLIILLYILISVTIQATYPPISLAKNSETIYFAPNLEKYGTRVETVTYR